MIVVFFVIFTLLLCYALTYTMSVNHHTTTTSFSVSVHPLAYHKNDMTKLHEIFFIEPMALSQSSPEDSAIRYVLQVLWMTSCFYIMAQIQIQAIGDLPGGTAGKVCYCRLPSSRIKFLFFCCLTFNLEV